MSQVGNVLRCRLMSAPAGNRFSIRFPPSLSSHTLGCTITYITWCIFSSSLYQSPATSWQLPNFLKTKGLSSSLSTAFSHTVHHRNTDKLIYYRIQKVALLKSFYSIADLTVVITGCLEIAFENSPNIRWNFVRIQVPLLRMLRIARHSAGWRLLLMTISRSVDALSIPLFF